MEVVQSFENHDYSDLEHESDYSDSSFYSSEYSLTAQEQWEESMQQIQALVSFVIFPLIGKVLGRRFSKIIWRRVAKWWYVGI
ncbi:hypothetical protein JA1_003722 [Spathaspora sp. JA1]|nr:hypothetical protein JA1_003722 [Spathaspora sp. JA1]